MNARPSPNFAYLAHHDARLVALATQAEEHFAADPTVTLFKLRQFGEFLAQRAAAKVGLFASGEEGQQQIIDRLWDRGVIGATQRSLFHDLRRVGNAAVHEGKGDHREALHNSAWRANSRSGSSGATETTESSIRARFSHL